MRTLSFLPVLLGLSIALWAQGIDCTQPPVTSTDNTCNDFTDDCEAQDHGCAQVNFTPQCTGYYDMDAWLTSNTVLRQCKVCVRVRKHTTGTVVGQCVLDVCVEGTTSKTCYSAAYLTAGESYDLYSCLTYCEDVNECDDHCVSCTAHGCLRFSQASPCWQ